MNNKTLQDLYTTFQFKDEAKTRYFFDIVAVKSDGNSEVEYPIISIRQNRKNATGADTFKKAIENIESSKSSVAVIIREYDGIADDCQPICVNRVELKKGGKSTLDDTDNKPQQIQQPPPVNIPLLGFGNLEQTNAYLTMVNNQLSQFGLGSLPDIMRSTSQSLSLQEKYDDAKMVIQELKLDNKQQLAEIQRLKDTIEHHKDQYKQLQYQLQDAQRAAKLEKESLETNLMWSNVIGRSLGGAIIDKFDLVNKFQGFLGVPQGQQAAGQTGQTSSTNGADVAPAGDGKLHEINTYLQSLDAEHIAKVYAICEFISAGDDKMNAVINYIESRK